MVTYKISRCPDCETKAKTDTLFKARKLQEKYGIHYSIYKYSKTDKSWERVPNREIVYNKSSNLVYKYTSSKTIT